MRYSTASRSTRKLEHDLESKLDLPREIRIPLRHRALRNGSEVRILRIIVELLLQNPEPVEHVERLCAELEADALADPRALEQGHIELRLRVEADTAVPQRRGPRRVPRLYDKVGVCHRAS